MSFIKINSIKTCTIYQFTNLPYRRSLCSTCCRTTVNIFRDTSLRINLHIRQLLLYICMIFYYSYSASLAHLFILSSLSSALHTVKIIVNYTYKIFTKNHLFMEFGMIEDKTGRVFILTYFFSFLNFHFFASLFRCAV